MIAAAGICRGRDAALRCDRNRRRAGRLGDRLWPRPRGLRTALLDEGDVAYRASRGNFGLVWVQSKGDGAPHYQRWTRRSADEWPALAAELLGQTGITVGHRPGGVHLCLSEIELEARHAMMERMRVQTEPSAGEL
jgi:hypothetical protein